MRSNVLSAFVLMLALMLILAASLIGVSAALAYSELAHAALHQAAPSNDAAINRASIILGGENRYKALRLTPQIYNIANSDLSDLRIIDGSGEYVPYFINTGYQRNYSSKEAYPLALINSYLKDDNFYFDYTLAQPRESDIMATSLEFSTGHTNFAKEIQVYGSYDNINWEFVQRDSLYAVDNKAKLAIYFAQPQKYTHYRLRLGNNLEQITFQTANLIYSIETREETYYIESLTPVFSVKSSDRKTEIIIEGIKNLRLCDLTIDSDSMFMRMLSTPSRESKELYNLSLNGTSYSDLTIPLHWSIPRGDTYTLTIADGDDRPIKISNITVRYYADEIVFEGVADGIYILEFGGRPGAAAPVYDINRYKNEILAGAIDRVALGTLIISEEAPVRDYRFIFNIVIIVVALLLGGVIIFKLKKA